MARPRIDRTGEKAINNFGNEMIITKYNGKRDIEVYFPKYNWTYKHTQYQSFKNGQIKCPYEPRYFGKGYQGEGKYKISEDGKNTKYFNRWCNMLNRCYNPKYQEKEPTYKGCEVNEYFLNFQNFCKWVDENYYEVPGERMELDKDILYKRNKIYSPETCMFVPQGINALFTKNNINRGKNPIGVSPNGIGFQALCSDGHNKLISLGTYSTKEEAFKIYKEYKEKVIKQIADEYKLYIPKKLYDAMYNYEVEIND